MIIAGLSKRLSIVEDGGCMALVVQEALEPQDSSLFDNCRAVQEAEYCGGWRA